MKYSIFMKNRIPHRARNGKTPVEVAVPKIDIIAQRQLFVYITGASAIKALAEDYAIIKTAATPYLTAAEDDTPADVKSFQALVGRVLFIAGMW